MYIYGSIVMPDLMQTVHLLLHGQRPSMHLHEGLLAEVKVCLDDLP